MKFDVMLENPPYGKSGATEQRFLLDAIPLLSLSEFTDEKKRMRGLLAGFREGTMMN